MDDLISRRSAIDAMLSEFKRVPTTAIRAKDVLKQLPSAESEIIHCKDCRWWYTKKGWLYGICQAQQHDYYSRKWEINIHRTCSPDFYCADAERRTDE